jgi:hypothetical protein
MALAQSDTKFPEQTPTRLSLKQLPAEVRGVVRQILEHPTLFAHGPSEIFAGDPNLYQWLLNHPTRAVLAWRRLGSPATDISSLGNGLYVGNDGHGDEIRWRTVLENGVLRVWFAEGRIRPAPLVPSVPVRAVILLRHGQRPDRPGRTLIYHQADIYAQVDSKTATLVIKMLGSSLPRLAEEGLKQIELFYSALVWYCDQHPERTEKLLAPDRNSNSQESDDPPKRSTLAREDPQHIKPPEDTSLPQ